MKETRGPDIPTLLPIKKSLSQFPVQLAIPSKHYVFQ